MDLLRLMVLMTVMIGLFILHALLIIFHEGMFIHSRALKPWGVECFYYTPVEIFTLEIEDGASCPARVKVPGSTG